VLISRTLVIPPCRYFAAVRPSTTALDQLADGNAFRLGYTILDRIPSTAWNSAGERGLELARTLYLVEMDIELLKLQRKGLIKYVRYVDDIKIFAKNRKTARSVIFMINRILRCLHLNMQSGKTQSSKVMTFAGAYTTSEWSRLQR